MARALGPNVKMGQGYKLLDPTSLNLIVTIEFYIKKKKKNHEKQYNILVLALVGKQISLAN